MLQAKFTALFYRTGIIAFYTAGTGNFELFAAVTLTLTRRPSYMNFARPPPGNIPADQK